MKIAAEQYVSFSKKNGFKKIQKDKLFLKNCFAGEK
jgi:hypothetical protein